MNTFTFLIIQWWKIQQTYEISCLKKATLNTHVIGFILVVFFITTSNIEEFTGFRYKLNPYEYSS